MPQHLILEPSARTVLRRQAKREMKFLVLEKEDTAGDFSAGSDS